MTNSAVEMTGGPDLIRTSPHFSPPVSVPSTWHVIRDTHKLGKQTPESRLSGFDAQLYHSIPAYDPE